jgi:hypothetical protein
LCGGWRKPWAVSGLPPVARALEEGAARPADERRTLAALATSHHSVFELFETSGEMLDVEDLIGGSRFAVRERRKPLGMAAGDLFEARLVWDGETVVFGKTFLFHPPDAREVVLEWIARAVATGVAHEEILFHLSRQHIRGPIVQRPGLVGHMDTLDGEAELAGGIRQDVGFGPAQ